MTKTYPAPAELDDEGLKTRDLGNSIGAAIAAQHPGVQIDTIVEESGFRFSLKHPAHTAAISARYVEAKSPGDGAMRHVGRANAMAHYLDLWTDRLRTAIAGVKVTNANGDEMNDVEGFMALTELMAKTKQGGRGKFIFVGNGGSAAIASHMAEDFTKNGGVRSITFNDAALLTCYANDYGWDHAFARMIDHQGLAGDVIVAISSSGKSPSIYGAVATAKAKAILPVTFSGFDENNPLRKMGQVNFFVPSRQYGFVETAHAALLHAALDIFNGWVGQA